MSVRDDRRDELFELATFNPEWTIDDVMATLGWTYNQVRQAIFDLRHHLGDTDSLNLVCEPAGAYQRWTYKLVGRLDDTHEWMANRVNDTETRLRTMQALMTSMISAHDGRTILGRKARAIERGLRHLVENLDAIAADAGYQNGDE